eukprot:2138541-Rhodomonas_salina.1
MAVHAFGVDTPATFNSSDSDWSPSYTPQPVSHSNLGTDARWDGTRATHPKLFDYVSVGMFAPWKRHEAITVRRLTRVQGLGLRVAGRGSRDRLRRSFPTVDVDDFQ